MDERAIGELLEKIDTQLDHMQQRLYDLAEGRPNLTKARLVCEAMNLDWNTSLSVVPRPGDLLILTPDADEPTQFSVDRIEHTVVPPMVHLVVVYLTPWKGSIQRAVQQEEAEEMDRRTC